MTTNSCCLDGIGHDTGRTLPTYYLRTPAAAHLKLQRGQLLDQPLHHEVDLSQRADEHTKRDEQHVERGPL